MARRSISPRGPRLIKRLEVVKCSVSEYYKLEHLHYLKQRPHFHTNTYKVVGIGYYRKAFPDPIAVTVYGMPLCNIFARDKATGGFFSGPPDRSSRLRLINQYIRYASRIVVDTRFRHLGIATFLAAETLQLQNVPIIETLVPFDWTANMLARLGFIGYPTSAPYWYSRFVTALNRIGVSPELYRHPEVAHRRLLSLDKSYTGFIEYEIQLFLEHFRNFSDMPVSEDRTRIFLNKIHYPQ
ncbi:unnamed protein product, partial [marine sediment metagenome]